MFRLLTPTDAQAYKQLRLLALQSDPLSWISTFEYESTLTDRFFADQIANSLYPPLFGYHGYFEQDKLIAYVMLEKHFGKQAHHATFVNLFVHPDYRKLGIARNLLTYIIEKAQNELDVLYVTAAADNQKALALYKNLGFNQYGIKPKYLKLPDGRYQDKSLLYLELNNKRSV